MMMRTKSWKTALSFLIVLVFVFQCAGLTAWAASDLSLAPLSLSVSVDGVDATEPDEGGESGDDDDNGGTPDYQVLSGAVDLAGASDLTLGTLMDGGLRIVPPEGYYVSLLALAADGQDASGAPSLQPRADGNSAEVSVAAERFSDGSDFNAALLADDEADAYRLLIRFSELPESVSITKEGAQESVSPAAVYEAGHLADTAEAHFIGWSVTYDETGAWFTLNPDGSFSPVADCTMRALWKPIITVTANAPVENEDGTFRANGFTVSETLASGDTLAEADVSITVTETEGKYIATPTAAVIRDEDGDDVSARYELVLVASDAVAPAEKPQDTKDPDDNKEPDTPQDPKESQPPVDPQPLVPSVEPDDLKDFSLKAVEAERAYNGAAFTASEYSENGYTNGFKAEGLTEGHRITAGVTVSGTIPADKTGSVDVTISVNKDNLKIEAADGTDVTAQYNTDNILTTPGKLTVTKRVVTITPVSAKKTYDAEPLKASEITQQDYTNGYKVEGLLENHGFKTPLQVTGEGTDVGKYPTSVNTSGAQILSGETDVTSCYDIRVNAGELEITQAPLKIIAISGNVKATGSTIYAKGYSTSKDNSTNSSSGFTQGFRSEGLMAGHALTGDFVQGSGTEGSFETSINKAAVVIVDTKNSNADVTRNYNITTENGKITITPQTVEPTPLSVTANVSKVYDGTALSISSKDLKITSGSALPAGYTMEASFSPASITDVQKVDVTISKVTIKDDKGNDITSQYKITADKGSMEVTKKALTLTAVGDTKTYDGKTFKSETLKAVKATALVNSNQKMEGVGYTIKDSNGNVIKNGPVNVGEYTKSVDISKLSITENGKDVKGNYDISTVDAKLIIKPGTTSKNNSTSPKTGDENHIGTWIALIALSALVVLAVLLILILRARKIRAAQEAAAQEAEAKAAETQDPAEDFFSFNLDDIDTPHQPDDNTK